MMFTYAQPDPRNLRTMLRTAKRVGIRLDSVPQRGGAIGLAAEGK